jgi:hypothetical protein
VLEGAVNKQVCVAPVVVLVLVLQQQQGGEGARDVF